MGQSATGPSATIGDFSRSGRTHLSSTRSLLPMTQRRRRALRPSLDRLDERRLLSGLTPAQVTRAYGLDAIRFDANGQSIEGDGSGQTIAIIDAYHNPYLAASLH